MAPDIRLQAFGGAGMAAIARIEGRVVLRCWYSVLTACPQRRKSTSSTSNAG